MNRIAISSALAALLALSLGCGTNDASFQSTTASEENIGTLPPDIQQALKALPSAKVTRVHRDGVPAFVVGNLGAAAQATDSSAAPVALAGQMEKIAPVFRLNAQSLVFQNFLEDHLGLKHAKYAQTKNGLPVVGGELIVHLDKNGTIYAVNGEARDSAFVPAQATLSADDAIAAAQSELGHDPTYSNPRQVYVLSTQDNALHLAWEVLAQGEIGDLPMKDYVYIDAVNGQLVDRRPTIYGALSRKVYSANNGTSLPGTLKRSEGSAATTDSAVNGAYDNTGITYNFYKTYFNRDSYNNAGAQLTSTVHYSQSYSNAYWDGSQMVYGDGDGVEFTALSKALDVTAHELTHAVTENTANLTYQNEPGALNEAMSDILGSATEAWNNGGTANANFYMIGETCYTPNTPGDALRYMDDPAKDGQSYDYYPTRYTGTQDYGGVHLNSGIANLAYALLVKGGTHPRNKTTTVVPSIGFEKATRIFYRALTVYMTSSTNFAGARTATVQAATDLYTATEAAAVDSAWTAVGVPGGSTGGGGTPPPPSGTVTPLTNGVAVSVSGATGSQNFFSISVPSGASNLTFKISGGSGAADLYVKYGAKPTTSSYDYRPYLNGNNETATATTATAGTWYVMLNGYAAYSGVSLVVTYTTSSGGGGGGGSGKVLSNGVPATISGASGSSTTWTFTVPSGATALTFKMSGGTGDADLYVRYGAAPTTSTWDYRPYLNGNNETVNATPKAGTWYVMVKGYQSYSGVSLVATYQ